MLCLTGVARHNTTVLVLLASAALVRFCQVLDPPSAAIGGLLTSATCFKEHIKYGHVPSALHDGPNVPKFGTGNHTFSAAGSVLFSDCTYAVQEPLEPQPSFRLQKTHALHKSAERHLLQQLAGSLPAALKPARRMISMGVMVLDVLLGTVGDVVAPRSSLRMPAGMALYSVQLSAVDPGLSPDRLSGG